MTGPHESPPQERLHKLSRFDDPEASEEETQENACVDSGFNLPPEESEMPENAPAFPEVQLSPPADVSSLVTRSQARRIKGQNAATRKGNRAKKEHTRTEVWERLLSSERFAACAPRAPEEALPKWSSSINATHGRIFERGSFLVCNRCGSFAATKPQKLLAPCSGQIAYKAPLEALVKKATCPPGTAAGRATWRVGEREREEQHERSVTARMSWFDHRVLCL